MRYDIFIVIAVLLLISAAGCQGSGSSSGGAPESPLNVTIVDLACPAYELPNRHVADTSETVNISLDRNYEDAVSGDILSGITLPPKTGKILIAR